MPQPSSSPPDLSGQRVLVTGGAGYIGSHTALRLLRAGAEICVLDNLVNCDPEVLGRLEALAGRGFAFEEADVRDRDRLEAVFAAFRPDAVIHFAGLKAVGDSVEDPLRYYDNNVTGSIALLAAMTAAGCRRIVFSSSATVYGEAQYLPLDEAHALAPANPYGHTKAMVEQIIADWVAADAGRAGTSLRYFNPIGAHASSRIGEDPSGVPANLVPFVGQVAYGLRPEVQVFGDDFDTRDGTGERDYIHVEDLAAGHVAALNWLRDARGHEVFNLGTGRGSTVLEVLAAFEKASGRDIPHRHVDRRPGDTASTVAEASKAERILGWTARRTLEEACRSHWDWQRANPGGYSGEPPAETG